MVNCKFLCNSTCAIIAKLTGCDQSTCIVQADACNACMASGHPQDLNYVTASIGIQVAKRHCDATRFSEVRAKLSPAIAVEKPRQVLPSGPGTELKNLLSRLGLKEKPGCGCKARAREMDHRGTEWCEANIETIVGWLREEADRQSLPFVDLAARALIRYAIRRAKK